MIPTEYEIGICCPICKQQIPLQFIHLLSPFPCTRCGKDVIAPTGYRRCVYGAGMLIAFGAPYFMGLGFIAYCLTSIVLIPVSGVVLTMLLRIVIPPKLEAAKVSQEFITLSLK